MINEIKATKPIMPIYEDYIEEIKSIWDTGIMTNNGPKLQFFRENLINYTKCKNLELFVNGHSALMIAIKALDLKGEAITSPFTFASTTNAIIQQGLTPVFCDIDESYNIDAEKIERHINGNTCAIIVPHIFGIPCNVVKIEEIAKRHNLKVIYDGAQAFGTKIEGENIGLFGDVTMFSLHAIKIFNAIEGGILTYRDIELKRLFELYRNFGISYGNRNDVECVGMNAKMNEFQAIMGILNLKQVDNEINERKKRAEYYCKYLKKIAGILPYEYQNNISYNYAYFPIIIDENKYGLTRDKLWEKLNLNNIHTRKLYDVLTCNFKCNKGKYKTDIEVAECISKRVLDLPLYSSLTYEEIDFIVDVIEKLAN